MRIWMRNLAVFAIAVSMAVATTGCEDDDGISQSSPLFRFAITWTLDTSDLVSSVTFTTDYSSRSGSFVGSGSAVSCTQLAGDSVTFSDNDTDQVLTATLTSSAGVTGVLPVSTCIFETSNPTLAGAALTVGDGNLTVSDFDVTVTEALKPDNTAATAAVTVSEVVPVTTTTTVQATTTTTTTTVQATTTTTSTTTLPPALCNCTVIWRVTSADTLGALQYDTDYSAASGDFEGSGASVSCTALVTGLNSFNDDESIKTLSAASISTSGFTGPINVASCAFTTSNPALAPSDFSVTITDQAAPDFTPTSATLVISSVTCDSACGGGTETTTTTSTSSTSTSSTSTSSTSTSSTSTTSGVTTTTTPVASCGPGTCTVSFDLDPALTVTLGAVQFTVDYTPAPGDFTGSGAAVSCTSGVPGLVTWNDDDTARTLQFAAIALGGIPSSLGTCTFEATGAANAGQFALTVDDASGTDLSPVSPLPAINVAITAAP